jgi:hypothetical protein
MTYTQAMQVAKRARYGPLVALHLVPELPIAEAIAAITTARIRNPAHSQLSGEALERLRWAEKFCAKVEMAIKRRRELLTNAECRALMAYAKWRLQDDPPRSLDACFVGVPKERWRTVIDVVNAIWARTQ